MMRAQLRSLVVLVALIAWSLPGVAPIAASSNADPAAAAQPQRCTVGAAQALFQALPVAVAMRLRGQDHPGLREWLSRCQYTLFHDGESFTFCEDDVILGGIVYLYDYKEAGVSRAAAIAEVELATDRVWLNGVEQVLERTTYKDVVHPIAGLSVYQHRAFITKLPPGDYVSVWVGTYPGLPDETATVYLHILPRALCA